MQKRRTLADYTEALTKAHGLVAVAAHRLGVSRQAVYNMARRHPEVNEVMIDAREELLDLAESKLIQAVNGGNTSAVFFVLKTLGKNRGYTTRTESDALGFSAREVSEMSDKELAEKRHELGI